MCTDIRAICVNILMTILVKSLDVIWKNVIIITIAITIIIFMEICRAQIARRPQVRYVSSGIVNCLNVNYLCITWVLDRST